MKTIAYFHDDNGNIGDTMTVMGCHALMNDALGVHYPISWCSRIAEPMKAVVLPEIDAAVVCGGPWLWDNCLKSQKYDLLRDFLERTKAPINIALGLGASYVITHPKPERSQELVDFWQRFNFIACRDALAADLLKELNADLWPCPTFYTGESLRPVIDSAKESVLVYTALDNPRSVPTAKYADAESVNTYLRFQEQWITEGKPVAVVTWVDRDDFVTRYSRQPDVYANSPKQAAHNLTEFKNVYTARVHAAILAASLKLNSHLFAVDSRALTAYHLGVKPFLCKYPDLPGADLRSLPQTQLVNRLRNVMGTEKLCRRADAPILIVVSTFNRKDLTGQTLDSIARNKSDLSDVLIIDDGSTDYDEKWLRQWGWKIVRNAVNLGVGEMARKRYEEFLTRGYAYLCAIDNDLQLGAHFDYRLLRLWQQTRSAELTVVTGYRSKTQVCLESNPEWDVVNSVGGAVQFTDRHTAQIIFTKMQDQWAHNWDHRVSLLYQRKIATRRSLAQHLGIYGSGVNGPSQDLAVDFVGDNQW